MLQLCALYRPRSIEILPLNFPIFLPLKVKGGLVIYVNFLFGVDVGQL